MNVYLFVESLCTSPPSVNDEDASSLHPVGAEGDWRPLLLVVPLRLGLQNVNPVYFNAVKVKEKNTHKLSNLTKT